MRREVVVAGLLVLMAACVVGTSGDALTDKKSDTHEARAIATRAAQGPYLYSQTSTCSSGLAFCTVNVANYLNNLASVFVSVSVAGGQIYPNTPAPCNLQRYFGTAQVANVQGTFTSSGGSSAWSANNVACGGTNRLCCNCVCDPSLTSTNCSSFFQEILTIPYDPVATVTISYTLTTADQVSWPGPGTPGVIQCQPTVTVTNPPTQTSTVTVTNPPTQTSTVTVTNPPTQTSTVTVTNPPTQTSTVTVTNPPTQTSTVTVTVPPTTTPSSCQSQLYATCDPNSPTPCCNANWRCARHQHAPGCGSPLEQFLCIPIGLVSLSP